VSLAYSWIKISKIRANQYQKCRVDKVRDPRQNLVEDQMERGFTRKIGETDVFVKMV